MHVIKLSSCDNKAAQREPVKTIDFGWTEAHD